MSTKRARVTFAVLCLLLASASFLSAGSDVAQQGGPLFQPAFLAAPGTSCELRSAGGGNCDTDADCPSGSYCYHDPIALVPYCVGGSATLDF